jgi:TPR repeat protein
MNAAERQQAAFEVALATYERGRYTAEVTGIFAQRAAEGNRVAEFFYAECLRLGRGVAVNLEAALHYYELAKQHGSPDAQAGLDALAADRARVAEAARAQAAKDQAQAARAQIEAAFGRGADGVAELRERLARGALGPADEARLAALLAASGKKVKAARGEVLGLYAKAEAGGQVVWVAVAGLYLDGAGGVPKNAREGMRILDAHVALGEPAAMLELGRRYAGGLGVARSLVKALAWYTQAGSAGLVGRARIYEQGGPGIARDVRHAVALYRSAYVESRGTDDAALGALERLGGAGNGEAQAALGFLWHTGQLRTLRVAAPEVEFVWRHYEAAAARGDAGAQEALGGLYAWQGGRAAVKPDPYGDPWASAGRASAADARPGGVPEALRWYGLAAAAGNAEAMFGIGTLIELGQTGGMDLGTARGWYEKAAAAGSARARAALR